MRQVKPSRTMMIKGYGDACVELTVYAETEWFAVTKERPSSEIIAVTHKPTGMAVQRSKQTLAEAKAVMRALMKTDIDWNWGQDWSSRKRHSHAMILRDKKYKAARERVIQLKKSGEL